MVQACNPSIRRLRQEKYDLGAILDFTETICMEGRKEGREGGREEERRKGKKGRKEREGRMDRGKGQRGGIALHPFGLW